MSDVPDQSNAASPSFVSRAGGKLLHALTTFGADVTGLRCADFGCNVGGFTDCLLQAGASHVYAVDTGYGTLAYTLRSDDRVTVMERTNALHCDPPDDLVDLVVIDLAWTPQRHALPAALRWLKADGMILTLVKPHYELDSEEKKTLLVDGRLAHDEAERILSRVCEHMPEWGFEPLEWTRSPMTGRKSSKGRKRKGVVGPGNVEFIVHARPVSDPS